MFDIEWALFAAIIAIAPIVAEACIREFLLKEKRHSINWRIGSGIIVTAIVVPIVFSAGTAISRSFSANYYEFWNGIEKSADIKEVTCQRDGRCFHTYDCDPYTVIKHYTDSNGKLRSRTVTKYHQCPYVSKELHYGVTDTMGNYHPYDTAVFPKNAENHKFRDGTILPDVQEGPGEEWVQAKARIDKGEPWGVTLQKSYANYLLPIQNDVYEKHSDEIPALLEKEMLPPLTKDIHHRYLADKAYFVGFDKEVTNASQWIIENGRFGGVMGAERQGDVHLVVVNADKAGDADKYAQALNAYWLSSQDLGAYTLSKNGIVIVVGVTQSGLDQSSKDEESHKNRTILSLNEIQGATTPKTAKNDGVKWVRSFTGMPQGNEVLVAKLSSQQTLESLKDGHFHPTGIYSATSPIPRILSDYHRIEMKNYEYLKNSIPVSTFANVLMLIISVGLSLTATFFVQFDRRN